MNTVPKLPLHLIHPLNNDLPRQNPNDYKLPTPCTVAWHGPSSSLQDRSVEILRSQPQNVTSTGNQYDSSSSQNDGDQPTNYRCGTPRERTMILAGAIFAVGIGIFFGVDPSAGIGIMGAGAVLFVFSCYALNDNCTRRTERQLIGLDPSEQRSC